MCPERRWSHGRMDETSKEKSDPGVINRFYDWNGYDMGQE